MLKAYYLFIFFISLVLSGCGRGVSAPATALVDVKNPADVESIVDVFKKGLQTNKENNPDIPDADSFGSALIAIAWERLANCPDAAPAMYFAFETFVSKSEAPIRYQQWDIFLENLEAALLKSRDAEHLHKNWQIREKAIEAQRKTLQEWIKNSASELGSFEKEIETERKKDLDEIVSPEKENETEENVVWKDGKYQEILNRFRPFIVFQGDIITRFWSNYRGEDEKEQSAADFMQRLEIASEDAARLQRLRYNLWAIQVLSTNSTIEWLAHIDTGLLEPEVSALYSQRVNDLITQQPERRAKDVRSILLRSKVPLEAF